MLIPLEVASIAGLVMFDDVEPWSPISIFQSFIMAKMITFWGVVCDLIGHMFIHIDTYLYYATSRMRIMDRVCQNVSISQRNIFAIFLKFISGSKHWLS